MPEQYTNPTAKPCAGSLKWSPPTSIQMGSLNPTIGFANLVIDRGAFRNLFYDSAKSNNVKILTFGNTSFGQSYYPVRNSTRPLALSIATRKANNNNFVTYADKNQNLIKLYDFTDPKSSFNVATIEIEYDLSFWINDPVISANLNSIFPNLTSTQKDAFQNMKNYYAAFGTLLGDSNDIVAFVSGLKPISLEIFSGNSAVKLNSVKLGYPITRVRSSEDIMKENPNPVSAKSSSAGIDSGVFFQKVSVKLGLDEKNRDDYPKLSDITLRVADDLFGTSLALVIKSIKVFAADRVNLQFDTGKEQLPAQAIGYSMFINGTFYPALQYATVLTGALGSLGGSGSVDGSGIFTWPQDNRLEGCNGHVKVYNPDYTTNSPGFAHSFNLHLKIVSIPSFGPLGDFLGAGALPYLGVIIGPAPFFQQFAFYGTSKKSNTNASLALGQVSFKQKTGTYNLLINGNKSELAQNIPILSYLQVLNSKQDFCNIINNQNIIEQDVASLQGSESFRLNYVDQFGTESSSETFKSSPERLSTLLNAYDVLPNLKFSKEQYYYNSFVSISDSSNRLYDLFTKSKPCLTFKLNTQTYTSSLFLESGFISATIKAFVKDSVGILDTKLVYRFYAVPNGSFQNNFDPNFRLNNAQTVKIVPDHTTNRNYLSIENFDNTWTFDNVLTSGNLETNLTDVNCALFIDGSNSNRSSTIDRNILSGQAYNYTFYCAIYAISTLNDEVSNYNLSNYTSLDFPIVSFSITSNFILTLPFYYLLSSSNGGYIRAQRDLGYLADYTKTDADDKRTFKVYDVLYGGGTFDAKKPYSGLFSTTNGFNDLLVCDYDSSLYPNVSTSFIVLISSKESNITEVDFVVSSYYELSNSKVASDSYNIWQLDFDLDEEHPNIQVKYEVDLIGANNQSLFKIVSSKFQSMKSKSVSLIEKIYTSFYLPSYGGTLIIRLIFKTSEPEAKVTFSNVVLSQNSIRYLSIFYKTPGSADIGFYEDLPIQPSAFVGNCNEYLLNLDLPPAGYVIYDALKGLDINGTLYSPTWLLSSTLPKGMEVVTKGILNRSFRTGTIAHGVAPYQIFFRTGQSSIVSSLDTKRHGSTNLIVTTTNAPTNSAENGVWQIVSEAYPRFFEFESFVNTFDQGNNVTNLILTNPVLATTSELIISGQSQTFSDNNTLSLTMESPGSYAIQSLNANILNPITQSDEQKIRMKLCPFTAIAYKNNEVFTAGVSASGNLFYLKDNVWDQTNQPYYSLIEGNPSSQEITTNSEFIRTGDSQSYYGLVSSSFPGIVAADGTDVVIFYVYQSGKNINTKNSIYARITNGLIIQVPILVFDFAAWLSPYAQQAGLNSSAIPDILQISAFADERTPNLYHIAFDCANKIFVMKVIFLANFCTTVDIALVYGNIISGSDTQSKNFVNVLQLALIDPIKNTGNIIKLNVLGSNSPYTKDLSNSQRVGYVDYDGFFVGVQFLDGLNIKEIIFDKSYTLGAELRTIGTKPG